MRLHDERFFVTGATGFVGACLVRRLVELGCEVHALVRPSADRWRLGDIESGIQFHTGDLTSSDGLADLVASIEPTVIYHLAVHGAYSSQTDADRIILTNVFGTWNLLKACAKIDYKVFVNTGSSSEYGFKQYAMRETDLVDPNSYYAVAKAAQTLLCQHVARADGRPVSTFRLFSVYGPYEDPTRLFPTVVRRCLAGRDLDMVSPDTARDFVYVDDVVDAYLQVDELSLQRGELFNIGTGIQSSMRDVVRAVLEATGASVGVNWGSMMGRIWDTDVWVADCTKVRRILRWAPKTRLEEGVGKTVGWFKVKGSIYDNR